jgi:DNA-binding NarL/FixJ family response regulator
MRVTRLLLADRHRSFVEALAMRLDAEPGFEVVAIAVHPDEALSAVRAQPVDVAVLAVDNEDVRFLSMSPDLRRVRPDLNLVAVSGSEDVGLIARVVRHNFRGWVPKEAGVYQLLDVLQAVERGETRIPPLLLTRLLPVLLQQRDERRAAEVSVGSLTRREQEVLQAIAGGATRVEIAQLLAISPHTVRTHMQSILTKLDVHTSLEAVAVARRALVS